jgi:hypothetical protein
MHSVGPRCYCHEHASVPFLSCMLVSDLRHVPSKKKHSRFGRTCVKLRVMMPTMITTSYLQPLLCHPGKICIPLKRLRSYLSPAKQKICYISVSTSLLNQGPRWPDGTNSLTAKRCIQQQSCPIRSAWHSNLSCGSSAAKSVRAKTLFKLGHAKALEHTCPPSDEDKDSYEGHSEEAVLWSLARKVTTPGEWKEPWSRSPRLLAVR